MQSPPFVDISDFGRVLYQKKKGIEDRSEPFGISAAHEDQAKKCMVNTYSHPMPPCPSSIKLEISMTDTTHPSSLPFLLSDITLFAVIVFAACVFSISHLAPFPSFRTLSGLVASAVPVLVTFACPTSWSRMKIEIEKEAV